MGRESGEAGMGPRMGQNKNPGAGVGFGRRRGLGAALAVAEGLPRTLSLFFTLLGMLLIAGLSIMGTGALILSRVGSRPAQSPPAASTPTA